jgi:3-hydroxyisobutyrate dehydrogenase-like beta-hydroxyacid dehydrogenase
MAATPLFRTKAPLMRDTQAKAVGQFYIGAKDAGLAAALARAQGLDLPLFAASESAWREGMAAGLASADVSAVARVIETRTKTKIAGS